MADHASAKKRARQTEKRRLVNRAVMSTMKTSIREAVEKKDFSNIDMLLRDAQSVIAKTRRKGVIHKNNMARRISRLTAFVNKARKAV